MKTIDLTNIDVYKCSPSKNSIRTDAHYTINATDQGDYFDEYEDISEDVRINLSKEDAINLMQQLNNFLKNVKPIRIRLCEMESNDFGSGSIDITANNNQISITKDALKYLFNTYIKDQLVSIRNHNVKSIDDFGGFVSITTSKNEIVHLDKDVIEDLQKFLKKPKSTMIKADDNNLKDQFEQIKKDYDELKHQIEQYQKIIGKD